MTLILIGQYKTFPHFQSCSSVFTQEKNRQTETNKKYVVSEMKLRAQSSGAVWKSKWQSWAPVPNKPTVSVDVKQHFNNEIKSLSSQLVGFWPGGVRAWSLIVYNNCSVVCGPVSNRWINVQPFHCTILHMFPSGPCRTCVDFVILDILSVLSRFCLPSSVQKVSLYREPMV